MLDITSLNYNDADFYQQLDTMLAWEASIDDKNRHRYNLMR